MTKQSGWVLVFGTVLVGSLATAMAADRTILGSKLLVSNPTGLEANRKVTVRGKESPSDILTLSDPTAGGATLQVIANGTTGSNETYVLDASGWVAASGGYRYRGPTGGDGDAVRSVVLKRSGSGAVTLRVTIKGNVGTQDVKVFPPNTGDDGGVVLDVAGGDRYCVAFGVGAGGNETHDSVLQWKITNAAAEPGCPTFSPTTTIPPTTTTTIPGPSPLCPMDQSRIIFAGGPGTGACHQFDDNQAACEQAFHIGGECGPASCYYSFWSGDCNGCGPNNEQEGSCVNTCTHGAPSCPGDSTRTIFAGYAGSSACTYLSYSQTLCEKAFHIDGSGQPASCYFDTDSNDCRGCGPNNLDAGECQNTCPICEGEPSRTIFTGGPGNSGCHKFDASPSSCEGAFVFSDNLAYNSCYYDTGLSECRGCGPNNQDNGDCLNSCPVCGDPSREIFVGGPGTSACSLFDGNPALCEQAFHMSGQCAELTSCYFDYDAGNCYGCGPNNEGSACDNVCGGPICGNGVIDVVGEECDSSALGCGANQVCSFDCQCQPCASTVVPAEGGSFSGSTIGASSSSAGSCGSGTGGSPEVVFQWTPATSGLATIDTCNGTDFDSVLYLLVGSCDGPEIDCDDDGCVGVTSMITPTVTAGTTYYIVVDGYGGDSGSFTLTVTPASPSGAFLDDF